MVKVCLHRFVGCVKRRFHKRLSEQSTANLRTRTVFMSSYALTDFVEDRIITCDVCGSDFPQDKSMRLTSWSEPVTEDTEWCCLICASRAFKEG